MSGDERVKKIPVTEKLVILGMRGVKLFHTPDGTSYGAVTLENGGTEIYPVSGSKMGKMLKQRYYDETRKPPSGDSVRTAIGVLDGWGLFKGDEIKLNNRVAWDGENIVYDMSNSLHEHVIINRDGWEVVQSKDPIFRRYAHQTPQVMPVSGGEVNEIFEVVNVAECDKLMTMVHLVASLIPDIPHPAPSICGEQGSAKSTASKMFKALIDPSEIDTASMPRNEDRMHQMLSHHWYIIFDNVSWIEDWQSDVFCRAITGQATAVRTLYTDEDDHIFKYKMCIGFNGISYLASRADLLDRSFSLRLDPINDMARMGEDEVVKRFNTIRGGILGAMFDALVIAIKVYPTVDIKSLPRMADFAKWGCAIAEGLGYTQADFMQAYYAKIEESNMNAIEANPVAELIMKLMDDRNLWVGTPTQLHRDLTEMLERDGQRKENVRGMKSVIALGNIHDRIAPNLRKIGIDWQKLDRTNNKRGYRIEKQPKNVYDNRDDLTNRDDCAPNVSCSQISENGSIVEYSIHKEHSRHGCHSCHDTLQPSKPIDFDQSTIDRIRKATSDAMAKSNNSDGCDIDQITSATRGLARTTVAKCVLLNPGGAWELGASEGLYTLRT